MDRNKEGGRTKKYQRKKKEDKPTEDKETKKEDQKQSPEKDIKVTETTEDKKSLMIGLKLPKV